MAVGLQDTSIQSLPDGLLTHLSDVAYLSLDLRRNKLKYLNPHVLYENGSDWESKGTTFVAGEDAARARRRLSLFVAVVLNPGAPPPPSGASVISKGERNLLGKSRNFSN